jgi:(1->4)-alpha-D-glucan 1-alpha-D-glucosylmutase
MRTSRASAPAYPVPRATYRLQLHAGFTFDDAESVVPYLAELGISHLYLSSFLKARAGSMHGYDVVDHRRLNPEIGDMAALDRLVAALRAHGMGIVLDFVPNHVGIGADNAWWMDVLEWGRESPFASYFDIDWSPTRPELRNKVLLPVLGDHYGAILERGELALVFARQTGRFELRYFEHRFPIAPRTFAALIEAALDQAPPAGRDALEAVGDLARGLVSERSGRLRNAGRRDLALRINRRLAELSPSAQDLIDTALRRISGEPAALHEVLERQAYRICFWRVAGNEINYRRFFDINDLAGLRMEDPEVFAETHAFIFELLREGKIQGLRIDHIDGLYNPAEYFRQLQGLAARAREAGQLDQPIYLVVEKILAYHERIRRDWPVAGTTGYDFMNLVGGLFVDPEGEEPLHRLWTRFIGDSLDFEREVRAAKNAVMTESMASELTVLADELADLAESSWRSRDFTVLGLREALRAVVAAFPVYRTYVTSARVTDNDRRYIAWAIGVARKEAVGDKTVFDFLEAVLSTDLGRDRKSGYARRAVVDFAMSLQQFTGPVMAKGFEDTALYRFNQLIALNEVGGDPTRFGTSCGAFHQANAGRLRNHPRSMLATATHDSKRGEDVRVRIAVLSEIAEEWRGRVERWSQLNRAFKNTTEEGEAPEPNDEYFLYQTMIGAWPGPADDQADFVERLVAAMVKSAREAKRRTSWAYPNPNYEQGVETFIRRICETDRRNAFLDDFLSFQARIAAIGMVYGLAQALFKLTAPGVPDIYQGCELWQLALVDPDNRRPVDFARRSEALRTCGAAVAADLLTQWPSGLVKLAVMRAALALRRQYPALFSEGGYLPLGTRGGRGPTVCGFARVLDGRAVVAAAPIRLARIWPAGRSSPPLAGDWRGVALAAPAGHETFRNVLTGETVSVHRRRGMPGLDATALFAAFPVALLESVGD